MAYKEYQKKRAELWYEYAAMLCRNCAARYVFDKFFDRAYALGRETETITQEEIEKAAEDYVSFEKGGKCYPNYAVERACCRAFKDGANFALGKQEKDAEISLWERLTDDEKREMQCRYHTNECVLRDHKKRTGDKAQSKAVARIKLLENLFGKENLNSENK